MFDTVHQHHTTRHTTQRVTEKVNVTEYRAPTDESVKLLNEMQAKAYDNIIYHVIVKNNTYEAMVMVSYNDYMENKYKFSVKFKFNGTDYQIDGDIDKFDISYAEMDGIRFGHQKISQTFFNKLSSLITIELMKENECQIVNLLTSRIKK